MRLMRGDVNARICRKGIEHSSSVCLVRAAITIGRAVAAVNVEATGGAHSQARGFLRRGPSSKTSRARCRGSTTCDPREPATLVSGAHTTVTQGCKTLMDHFLGTTDTDKRCQLVTPSDRRPFPLNCVCALGSFCRSASKKSKLTFTFQQNHRAFSSLLFRVQRSEARHTAAQRAIISQVSMSARTGLGVSCPAGYNFRRKRKQLSRT